MFGIRIVYLWNTKLTITHRDLWLGNSVPSSHERSKFSNTLNRYAISTEEIRESERAFQSLIGVSACVRSWVAEQLGTDFFFNLKTVNLIVEHQIWKNNNHYTGILVAYRTTKLYHQMARCSLDMQARTQTYKQVCVWGRGGGAGRANLNNFIKGVRTLKKSDFEVKIRGVNSVSGEKNWMDWK